MTTSTRGARRYRRRLVTFLFPSPGDTWLTLLRVGLGAEVILYCVALRREWQFLLADNGIIRRQFAEVILAAESPFIPTIDWLVAGLGHLGIGETATLSLTWVALLASGLGLVAGLQTRICTVIAWLLHLCAAKSGGLLSYGVDNFMTIGLFYLALSPLPDSRSLDAKISHGKAKNPRLVGFFRRVLQLHLCLIYFFSGLSKCLGSGWWNGLNLWRALIRPPFNIIAPEVLLRWDHLLPLAGLSVLALEIGYPFVIWREKWRLPWLVLVCAMHVGIGAAMGMYLFGVVMIVLNVAAFGPSMYRHHSRGVARSDDECGFRLDAP